MSTRELAKKGPFYIFATLPHLIIPMCEQSFLPFHNSGKLSFRLPANQTSLSTQFGDKILLGYAEYRLVSCYFEYI